MIPKIILPAALGLTLAGTSAAVTLMQVDDFSGGVAGWQEGGPSPNPPVTFDTGLSGGAYLSNSASGQGGPGGRMAMWNQSQWAGDFIGQGVGGIGFDALSTGTDPVDLRIGFNGPGGWFTTPSIRIDDFAAGPDLTTFFLPIGETDLFHVTGGTGSYADTMGSVSRMEIYSAVADPAGAGALIRGDVIDATLLLDNITALPIPEPGTGALLVLAAASLLGRRRR